MGHVCRGPRGASQHQEVASSHVHPDIRLLKPASKEAQESSAGGGKKEILTTQKECESKGSPTEMPALVTTPEKGSS
ncbi:hypothetical protein NDU88_005875 [Pleurodeles waltl]|uniref:Uncharacterized protein n=1 Tax=Pleurodeles waltl TaxID=8319 RepID=A0AAV7PGP1_PLEWA|nr:hypothetical protein NDU88_005875 [Pleurodeles waltl]